MIFKHPINEFWMNSNILPKTLDHQPIKVPFGCLNNKINTAFLIKLIQKFNIRWIFHLVIFNRGTKKSHYSIRRRSQQFLRLFEWLPFLYISNSRLFNFLTHLIFIKSFHLQKIQYILTLGLFIWILNTKH